MATTTPRDLIAVYLPAEERWQWVTISTFVNVLQPQGWLVGTRKMMKDNVSPAGPPPRVVDDGAISNDPDNVDGLQEAKRKVFAPDMRGKSSGAVETLGNWRINGTGQRATGYVRAKDNTQQIRVNYRSHGAGDRTMLLMLPDVDDNGTPWETEVTFPDSSNNFVDVDFAAVPLPSLPTVKIRFKQENAQNGNVSIQSIEVL